MGKQEVVNLNVFGTSPLISGMHGLIYFIQAKEQWHDVYLCINSPSQNFHPPHLSLSSKKSQNLPSFLPSDPNQFHEACKFFRDRFCLTSRVSLSEQGIGVKIIWLNIATPANFLSVGNDDPVVILTPSVSIEITNVFFAFEGGRKDMDKLSKCIFWEQMKNFY